MSDQEIGIGGIRLRNSVVPASSDSLKVSIGRDKYQYENQSKCCKAHRLCSKTQRKEPKNQIKGSKPNSR